MKIFIVIIVFVFAADVKTALVDFFDVDDMFYQVMNTENYDLFSNEYEHCKDDDKESKEAGVCMSKRECKNNNGVGNYDSKCGHFKTCCVVKNKCNSKTSAKISYFEYSDADDKCTYTINKLDNVCQLRIDFLKFDLSASITNAKCSEDFVRFNTDSKNDLKELCGFNEDQHIYLHVKNQDSIKFDMKVSDKKNLHFKVTQLLCSTSKHSKTPPKDFKLLAPSGCTQYFTEETGNNIRNLNWRSNTVPFAGEQSYSLCIKRKSEDCTVTLSNLDVLPLGATDEFSCPSYLYIPGLKSGPIVARTCKYTSTPNSVPAISPGVFFLHFENKGTGYFLFDYKVESC